MLCKFICLYGEWEREKAQSAETEDSWADVIWQLQYAQLGVWAEDMTGILHTLCELKLLYLSWL